MGNSTALKSLSVEQLKNLLRVKGLSTSGKKDIVIRCLEGVVSGESYNHCSRVFIEIGHVYRFMINVGIYTRL